MKKNKTEVDKALQLTTECRKLNCRQKAYWNICLILLADFYIWLVV